jgi:lipopolysaccharide/colanic/teichoic acid biosynthesis glycosyltransferase
LDRGQTAPRASSYGATGNSRNSRRSLDFGFGRRVFDIGFAAMALAITLPLALAIMMAIRLTSPGPATYKHRRVGRNGTGFDCLKFRTMVPNAEAVLEELLAECEDSRVEFEATYKLKDDPRVTRMGRFLRKTSLDELPQFWNVIRGDMSVVGPRPIVDDEKELYGPALDVVLSVRPGLTGLWQVSGRNDLDYESRVALDKEYVETRNWWTDLGIIARTLGVMLKSDNGAY